MSTHVVKPIGQVGVPGILCGLAGTGLAIGLDVLGLLAKLEVRLTEVFKGKPFFHQDFSVWDRQWDWVLAGVLSILVAIAVLDSPGAWRRFFVGLFSVVLIACVVPILVLWGVYWSPVVSIVAVVWAWFCALVYSSQHRMLCDIALHLGEEHIHLKTSEEIIEEVVAEEHIRVETIPFPIPVKKAQKGNADRSESKNSDTEEERWKPAEGKDQSRKES